MTRWTREVMMIPYHEAEAYRAAGWTVQRMRGYHGCWSMMAWRLK